MVDQRNWKAEGRHDVRQPSYECGAQRAFRFGMITPVIQFGCSSPPPPAHPEIPLPGRVGLRML